MRFWSLLLWSRIKWPRRRWIWHQLADLEISIGPKGPRAALPCGPVGPWVCSPNNAQRPNRGIAISVADIRGWSRGDRRSLMRTGDPLRISPEGAGKSKWVWNRPPERWFWMGPPYVWPKMRLAFEVVLARKRGKIKHVDQPPTSYQINQMPENVVVRWPHICDYFRYPGTYLWWPKKADLPLKTNFY